jgi:hypothetical protein
MKRRFSIRSSTFARVIAGFMTGDRTAGLRAGCDSMEIGFIPSTIRFWTLRSREHQRPGFGLGSLALPATPESEVGKQGVVGIGRFAASEGLIHCGFIGVLSSHFLSTLTQTVFPVWPLRRLIGNASF